ncbi:hypothetical protein MKX07_005387 [Trichoderma sp. CBMAI-0711]|nr:hypothetical protein MKX07_005387 [Trichoderma sp. CBMAI-0711]
MSSPAIGQPSIPPTPSDANVSGKTVIVTGGASRMILACRSIEKGQEAASALRAHPTVKETNPNAVIEAFELDLDDYQSGLCFSDRVKAEVKELDILLNNGGQVVMGYEKSKSGHERSMQGSATQIMQNTLSKQHLSSESTVLGHFDDEANFNKLYRYADSKTIVNAYVRRLAALAPSEVVVNNACPGLVQTGIDKNLPFYLKLPMGLLRKSTGRTVEEGARTLIYAAVVAGTETNGKFLQHNQVDPGAEFLNTAEGEGFISKLWKESVQDVAATDPALGSYA